MSFLLYYSTLKGISTNGSNNNNNNNNNKQNKNQNKGGKNKGGKNKNKGGKKNNNNNRNNKNKAGSSSSSNSTVTTFSAKKSDFAKWYEQIIICAEIMDKRFPVKGMPIFRPYGFFMHNKIMDIIGEEWQKQGIERALFPLLVPEDFLETEGEHVAGFKKEVYWVTKGGEKDLDIPRALRPTSETIMYYMFSLWIKSFRDLPLKVHQTCNVFRYETKQTRPLIRAREIHWNEAHTAHETSEDALDNLEKAWSSYLYLINQCCCFYGLRLRRPEWDKFPGSEHTDVLDTVMPCGRVLQTVGAHYLGQKFSKAFKIQFLDRRNKFQHPHLTCYGISTRLLAATLSIHGDDNGLVVPPTLARYQVVIIPITMRKRDQESVLGRAKQVQKLLESSGIRTLLDDGPQKPGAKYYHWEMKGVPIRLEIGPRDVKNNTVMIVTRDNKQKQSHQLTNCLSAVQKTINEVTSRLQLNARKHHDSTITTCKTKEQLVATIKKGGFARIPFYTMGTEGNKGDEIIHEWCGGEVRGFLPHEARPTNEKCIATGKPATYWGYVARSY